MITMRTAYTLEIDEVDKAVGEILAQLDLERTMRKHAVGIVTCYSEFIDTGVVKALCDSLPFDVVGCTTIAGGASGQADMLALSLAMLTSDDVAFSAVRTENATDAGVIDAIAPAYQHAREALGGVPSMVLSFFPMITAVGGERMLMELDRVSNGVPVFGTLACDHLSHYGSSSVIFNGEPLYNEMAMVLFEDSFTPKFVVTAIPDAKIQKQRAIITTSEGNTVKEVNGMPMNDYVKELGLVLGDGIEGMSSVPFLVTYREGDPSVARAIYQITPEGYAVCGAEMTEGATLAIGAIDDEAVLQTAQETGRWIHSQTEASGVLLFQCLSRLAALGADVMSEMNVIQEALGVLPYHITYSGGEMCPIISNAGQKTNCFHNFSMVGCIFS